MRDLDLHDEPDTGPRNEPVGNRDTRGAGGPPDEPEEKLGFRLGGIPGEPRSFTDY